MDFDRNALDRHITGNYGDDQFPDDELYDEPDIAEPDPVEEILGEPSETKPYEIFFEVFFDDPETAKEIDPAAERVDALVCTYCHRGVGWWSDADDYGNRTGGWTAYGISVELRVRACEDCFPLPEERAEVEVVPRSTVAATLGLARAYLLLAAEMNDPEADAILVDDLTGELVETANPDAATGVVWFAPNSISITIPAVTKEHAISLAAGFVDRKLRLDGALSTVEYVRDGYRVVFAR